MKSEIFYHLVHTDPMKLNSYSPYDLNSLKAYMYGQHLKTGQAFLFLFIFLLNSLQKYPLPVVLSVVSLLTFKSDFAGEICCPPDVTSNLQSVYALFSVVACIFYNRHD